MTQNSESQRYLPNPVQTNVQATAQQSPDALAYPQYLATVRAQLASAQDIHEALAECARKIGAGAEKEQKGGGAVL